MFTAGIDIGGTQLRAGVFDGEHRLLDSYRTPTDRDKTAEENMRPLMDFLHRFKGALRGVGIGCPGPLSVKLGKMLCPPNLSGWDGFEIVKFVSERAGAKAFLSNDAGAACLAEAVLGAGKGFGSVCYVGVSTGIGGGFVSGGRLFVGAHSNASEIWNMIVNDDKIRHKNANPGSLNEQSSGSGLSRIATARYGRDVSSRELFDMFYAGDEKAREIVARAADALGRGIANLTCTFDPDAIVMGGPVALQNPDYAQMIIAKAREYCVYPDELKILPAQLGDDAGLYGASLLVD